MSERVDFAERLAPRPLSSLTYRILGINIIAGAILVLGILYLGQYRQTLIQSEVELLRTEVQFYSALMADAMGPRGADTAKAEKLAQTLSQNRTLSIAVLTPDAEKVMTRTALPYGKILATREQADPDSFLDLIDRSMKRLVNLVSVEFNLPGYPLIAENDYSTFPDVEAALEDDIGLSVWRDNDGGLLLSAAAPILKDSGRVGIIVVTKTDTGLEATFSRLRMDVMRIFLIGLTITVSLSLYLSAMIGHPLRELAMGAEQVRMGMGGSSLIPDFSQRGDEIGELSLSLRAMTGAIEQRMDAIEHFAADVAHELKNPLTSLRSALETMERLKDPADRLQLYQIAMHDLQRMDRLISDISAASRLDAELLRDKRLDVDIGGLLREIMGAWEKSPRAEGRQIALSLQPGPMIAAGNPHRLRQVFDNLIDNALSFSPAGSTVLVSAQITDKNRIAITVDDQGPGIPPANLETIFQRFYTERPAAEQFGSHSGLGLSISRQIARTYGGDIRAENRYGSKGVQGARFTVELEQSETA